jgi:Transposase IS116/IS110/IS902 family
LREAGVVVVIHISHLDSARLLTTLPGVSDLTARVMVAEIGVDMTRFITAAQAIITKASQSMTNGADGVRVQ